MKRFPSNTTTQKGNLAEIVLAEYLVETTNHALPVYRLRYNPNIDQSMKGDDVLAFDLDAKPVRLLVGEAKFRSTSTNAVVVEIVETLSRSQKAGIPVSLQFVADRLYEAGKPDFGDKVLECASLFARDRLRIDYVGLLLSDVDSGTRVKESTPNSLRNLVMISLAVQDPETLNSNCYRDLDQ